MGRGGGEGAFPRSVPRSDRRWPRSFPEPRTPNRRGSLPQRPTRLELPSESWRLTHLLELARIATDITDALPDGAAGDSRATETEDSHSIAVRYRGIALRYRSSRDWLASRAVGTAGKRCRRSAESLRVHAPERSAPKMALAVAQQGRPAGNAGGDRTASVRGMWTHGDTGGVRISQQRDSRAGGRGRHTADRRQAVPTPPVARRESDSR